MGLVPQDRKGHLNFRASWAERVTLKVWPLQEHEDWEDRDHQKADTACMGVRMERIRRERSRKGVVQRGWVQMGGREGYRAWNCGGAQQDQAPDQRCPGWVP